MDEIGKTNLTDDPGSHSLLREDAARLLASIVESSEDAIVSKDLNGRILTWNTGAERIFGYTAAEAVGSQITLIIPPELHDEERSILERLRRGERIEHFETWRVDKLGRRKAISLSVSPVRDASGRIVGAAKVARDITAQQAAAAENARLCEELRAADRRKDEFLAVLAHELRNPLAPLANALHIMRLSDDLSPAVERLRGIMETQVQHLARLVDDLLEVSRITEGKIELRKEPVELASIVRSAVETSRPLIESAGHQLAIQVPPEPIRLDADGVRLAQVVANLLNNAAKYTNPGGQIWLTAGVECGSLFISVRDNGMGIDAEMLPRVFDLYAQVEQSRPRAQGGLGLGLAVARRLVELHGGAIEAHSEGPGCGSQFLVRLPLAEAPALAASCAESVLRTVPRSLPRRRVLVVDDTRVAAYTLGRLLEALGQDVTVACDAHAALDAAQGCRPDLVISDIAMPGTDGYELVRQLRRTPGLEQTAMAALTGYGQESDRRRALAAGFDAHLIKPISVQALQDLLESLPAPDANRPAATHC